MNQNEQQTGSANYKINDLAVAETEQAEIKGGPKKIFIGGLSAKETQTELADLEPSGEIKGGPGSGAGGVWMNHNETVVADEANDDPAKTARFADLPVTEERQEEVKGGLLLPAVQKVREAAARTQSASSGSGMSAGKVSLSDLS